METFIYIIAIIIFYFLPFLIAFFNNYYGKWMIFWFNLFVGWTIIAWFLLLLFTISLKKPNKSDICGRYADVDECLNYPCCIDCPYKKDKV